MLGCFFYILCELLLRESVDISDLLLLLELDTVFGKVAAVLALVLRLSRGGGALLEDTLGGKTLLAFQEEFFACASTYFTFWIGHIVLRLNVGD